MLLLLLPSVLASVLVPASGDDETSRCTVEWSESTYPDLIDFTEPQIHRRCERLLESLKYEPPPDSIFIEFADGEDLKFRVRIRIEDKHHETVYSSEFEPCYCTSNELTASAMRQLASGIETLREPSQDDPPPSKDATPTPTPTPTPSTAKKTPPLGPLGGTGIVFLAGGLATSIAGAAFVSRTETFIEDPQTTAENLYRTRGSVLLGLGIGAAVAGSVMLGIDVHRRKKKRRNEVTFALPFQLRGRF